MVFPRQLERRLSNLTISLLILPSVVEAILVILFPLVAHGRPQLVRQFTQSLGMVISCLHALENQLNVVVGLTFAFLSCLRDVVDDLDAIHTSNRFLRTIFPAIVPRVILSIIELQQTCPNNTHIQLLLLSYGSACGLRALPVLGSGVHPRATTFPPGSWRIWRKPL